MFFHKKPLFLSLSLAAFTLTPLSSAIAANFNYAEGLQKAIFFYDMQRSGKLTEATGLLANRVYWRADSFLQDYALPNTEGNINLGGGFPDAGDNIKFNFPMAGTTTILAWGIIEFRNAYQQSGQLNAILANLHWATDYLLACWDPVNVRLYGQVSPNSVASDHDNLWMPYEVVDQASIDKNIPRYAWYVDAAHPGTELAGETVAALTAASMAFQPTDPAYAATLLSTAKTIYQALVNTPNKGTYSSNMGRMVNGSWQTADVAAYYNSYSGYHDEVAWSSMWLYRATQDPSYIPIAEQYILFGNLAATQSWDDKSYGTYLLMAKFLPDSDPNKAKALASAQGWLSAWANGTNGHTFSAQGLAIAQALTPWGNARYAATTAFCALVYDAYFNANTYNAFAKGQIDYLLGKNNNQFSYVIGFGNKFPLQPHHATYEGRWDGNNDVSYPGPNRHIGYGGLVGGPTDTNDTYQDLRSNYVDNEVAMDYNAGLVGALAALYGEYSGTVLPASQFPPTAALEKPPLDQIFVNGAVQSGQVNSNNSTVQVDLLATNHTAWPARVTRNLMVRYFVNLADKPANGTVTINTYATDPRAVISKLQLFDAAQQIYYVEVWFKNIPIYPGGDNRTISSKETQIQFLFSWPHDYTKDWSYQGLGSQGNLQEAPNVPIYEVENGQANLLFGKEPTSTPQGNLTLNFNSSLPTDCLGAKDTLSIGTTNTTFSLTQTPFVYSMAVGGPYAVSLSSTTTPIAVTGGTCKGTLSANQVSVPGQLSVSYIFTPTPPPPPNTTGTIHLALASGSDQHCLGAKDTFYLDQATVGSPFTVASTGLSEKVTTGAHQIRLASQSSIPAPNNLKGTCSSTLSATNVTVTQNNTTTVTVTYQYTIPTPPPPPATGTISVTVSPQSDSQCYNLSDTLYLDQNQTGKTFTVASNASVSQTTSPGTHVLKLASFSPLPAPNNQQGTCQSTLSQTQVNVTSNQTSAVSATYAYTAVTPPPKGMSCTIVSAQVTEQGNWGNGIVNTFSINVNLQNFPANEYGMTLINTSFVMKNNFVQNFWGNFGMSGQSINGAMGTFTGQLWPGQLPFNLGGFIYNQNPLQVGENPLQSMTINDVICTQSAKLHFRRK